MQKPKFKIGDLVCEKNYPSGFGLVVGIVDLGEKHEPKIKVQWQHGHPIAWNPNAPEVVDPSYLELATEQDQGKHGPEDTIN